MKPRRVDQETERFRTLIPIPTVFKPGFGWTTVVGLIFCGLIMMPGAIYLGLMTGGNLSSAASWVTVILFMEISRRALKPLNQQELVVLLHAAHVMMVGNMIFPGGPLAHLVFRAYLVTSDAVRDAGMLGAFPWWFAPSHESEAILERNLLHPEWVVPILLMAFVMFVGFVNRYTLGYVFFRLTSDVERLPFPLAPIQAQGAMALAEAEDTLDEDPTAALEGEKGSGEIAEDKRKKGRRWRIFSLGAYIGLAFGMLQIGVPSITGILLAEPFFLIPQPFVDTTTFTEGLLPATPTGVALDAGILFLGFVLPFWAVIGTAIAIILTILLNPVMHSLGWLTTWQPGMDTVNTTFSNNVDFYLSFNIGAGFGIAAVCVFSTVRDLRRKVLEDREKSRELREDIWAPPRKGRGDYSLKIAIGIYCIAAAIMVAVGIILLPFSIGIAFFLIFFAFVYSPFISYVNARLLGISGQNMDIPYIKETSFLLSGARGIEIWLAPVPIENFGHQAQSFRVTELTGVNFWSLIKTDLVAFPILFVLSLGFWAFIWSSDPVPGPMFPAAQVNWDLQAKNQALIMSSTFVVPGEDIEDRTFSETELGRALKPSVIAGGFLGIVGLYSTLMIFGLPVMLVYGLMRGLGQFPHMMVLEIIGAVLGRFYLRKKYGETNFLRIAPTLLAGYFTGVGLIAMATIAMRLIHSAVSGTPF